MAQTIVTIRKRSTFLMIRKKGKTIKGKTFNVQFLQSNEINNLIYVGFTATKRIGNAVHRNKAKRIMRELARKVISKFGKINSYYVIIAKPIIFEISFESQKIELKNLIS